MTCFFTNNRTGAPCTRKVVCEITWGSREEPCRSCKPHLAALHRKQGDSAKKRKWGWVKTIRKVVWL